MIEVQTISNSVLKEYASLKLKKFRQKYNKYIVEGEKMVYELVNVAPESIESIIITHDFDLQKLDRLNIKQIILFRISEKEQKKITTMSTAPPVMAIVKIPTPVDIHDIIKSSGKYFYLDGIKDPGNLGTIIRSLDWFGYQGLFLSSDTVDVYNPKVVQSTMGSIFRLPIVYCDIEDLKSYFKSGTIVGLRMDGQDCRKFKLPADQTLFVLGSESQGLRKATLDHIDQMISIPGFPSDHQVESLNASIAAAIIAYEFRRQK